MSRLSLFSAASGLLLAFASPKVWLALEAKY
jgi:hypothetical protein